MENLLGQSVSLGLDKSQEIKTNGLEKLEFLTDKATRLIFQLEAEEEALKKLRIDMRQARQRKSELIEINKVVRTKLTSLENDRELIDERIGKLLAMIEELDLE